MVARNFSEDGAIGANSNGVVAPAGGGSFGSDTGGGNQLPPSSGAPTSDMGTGSTQGPGSIDAGNPFGNPVQNPQGANWDVSGITAFGDRAPTSPGGSTAPVNTANWDVSGVTAFGDRAPTSAAGLSFADGGAIPEDDSEDPNATDPQGSAMGASLQRSINDAMTTVKDALSYGRQLHGLGGGQQQAARMPTQPGNQSESGTPRQQPTPGPLPPTANPFGKRADAEGAIDTEGGDQTAAMPSVPFSESQRPQPMPGPLPPTSNPFGKRGQQADAGDDAAPAVDTEEDA